MKVTLDSSTISFDTLPRSLQSFQQQVQTAFSLSKECVITLYCKTSSIEVCCDDCLADLKATSEVLVVVNQPQLNSLGAEGRDTHDIRQPTDYDLSLLIGTISLDSIAQTPFVKCLAAKLRQVAEVYELQHSETSEEQMLKMLVLWPKSSDLEVSSSQADFDLAKETVAGFSEDYLKRVVAVMKHCTLLSTWTRKDMRRQYNLHYLDPALALYCHSRQIKPGFERLCISAEQQEEILDNYEVGRLNMPQIRNQYCISDSRLLRMRKARKDGHRMKDCSLDEVVSLSMKTAWEELCAELD
jgi:hypothetical protein